MKAFWGDLSRFRSELFGLSIIEILIFHFFENYFNSGRLSSSFLTVLGKDYYLVFGAIGVEIFLFLSGMGLYYSLNRTTSGKVAFYKRRFKRILPSFLPVAVIYYVWLNFIKTDAGIYGFIKGISFFNLFRIHDTTYWFIFLIFVMYILFPYLYQLLRGNNGKRKLNLVLVLVIWVAICYLLITLNFKIFMNIEIFMFRIPIFILGIYFGKAIMDNRKLSLFDLVLLCVIAVLKFVFIHDSIVPIKGRIIASFWMFPVIFLCIIFIKTVIIRIKWLDQFIKFTGSISLELYIIHVSLREIFNAYGFSMAILWHYLVMVCLTYVLAILLKMTQDRVLVR